MLLSLTIDPVHPDAAAARRAVPVYQDFYRVVRGRPDVTRVARFRRKDDAKRQWRVSSRALVIMTLHRGWSRGGRELAVYRLGR